jgi:hypothetical protein
VHAGGPFIDALARGAADDALRLLATGAYVDDPRAGRVSGGAALRRWLGDAHAWLAALSARAEPVRTTVQGSQACVERIVHVSVAGDARQLPLAAVAEVDAAGRLAWARLYYSMWSIEQRHLVRPRLLPPRPDLVLAPPVDAYQRALAEGDVDAVLACYERGATAREPAGEPWVHRGPRGLRRLYGSAFCYGGGVVLERGNAVDDGVACALEYTAVRWGSHDLPPQAGLAVYERGRSGRFHATRFYDDVEPPRE